MAKQSNKLITHAYEGFQDVPHFRDVLREVEADPTSIFFG